MSPGRRQVMNWTNAGILLIGPWGTNFSEILIEIHAFENVCKMASISSRPQWVKTQCVGVIHMRSNMQKSLKWSHNERDGVSNHRRLDCLLNNLFRRRSKKTSKLRVTGLCVGNSPVTGEFPAQRASKVKNVSVWWRHHAVVQFQLTSSNCTGYMYYVLHAKLV